MIGSGIPISQSSIAGMQPPWARSRASGRCLQTDYLARCSDDKLAARRMVPLAPERASVLAQTPTARRAGGWVLLRRRRVIAPGDGGLRIRRHDWAVDSEGRSAELDRPSPRQIRWSASPPAARAIIRPSKSSTCSGGAGLLTTGTPGDNPVAVISACPE